MELRSPLPRGRHGLSREDVVQSQRHRLQHGVVDLVASQGFAATTVQQIVAAAAVSRQTFYELYRSKEECYEAALRGHVEQGLAATAPEFHAEGDPLARLERGLHATLWWLAQEPALTHCMLFEASGTAASRAGQATSLRRAVVDALELVLGPDDPFAVHGFAAMSRQLVEEYVAAGRTAELPDLAAEIVGIVRQYVRGRSA